MIYLGKLAHPPPTPLSHLEIILTRIGTASRVTVSLLSQKFLDVVGPEGYYAFVDRISPVLRVNNYEVS